MKSPVSLRPRTGVLAVPRRDKPLAVIASEAGRTLDIEGRTSRRDYAVAVTAFLLAGVGLSFMPDMMGLGMLAALASWGLTASTITMTARRLRDAGLSAWFSLGMLVPFVNIAMAVGLSVVDDAGTRLRLR